MRHRHLSTLALALGIAVLLDVLRVWLPSVITLFGQAAETPAELLGAFALGWFVLALAAPALVRRAGAGPVGLLAAGVLAAARLGLTAQPGGPAQLWLACAGLLAGLVWLAAVAASVPRPVAGLALGLAGNAVGHALLGTEDLVWRGGVLGWSLSIVLVLAFLAASVAARREKADGGDGTSAHTPGRRTWLLCGPALLLAGQVALAPAVWNAAAGSGSPGFPGLARPGNGALPGALAVLLFLAAALFRAPARPARVLWPLALLAGSVLFVTGRLVPAYLLTAAGLGGCLALTDTAADDDRPGEGRRAGARRGRAAVLGMLVFAVATVAYYAAYDLGYPNGWAPVATAVLVALVAAGVPVRPALTPPDPVLPARARLAALACLTASAALAAALHAPPAPARATTAPTAVRVAAYNIRMGFGLDGRLDLDALARELRDADVVLLSEVDRGWWLNGGHDTLGLLARRLEMPYVFAPAADPVWGDAVLSRFPARSGQTRRLTGHGAPTGAQVLGVTLDLGGRELAVVATHLQPPPGRDPVEQAREVAAFAGRYAAGRPLVLGGDLNTEPADPAFAEFTGAGLVDALGPARPLRTSPADDPRTQIDHVFVSPGLTATEVRAPRTEASDHLPVTLTVTLP
ncbi:MULTISPECIES: endonuclease/exonuclease/phosphatase family protein [unclassified Micromonospora]|uniref:endonuclease/exonuclease/phosphatase family protein n=1 Tax=unclassified Micromonospora TaxID=2617518 RepID=UPI001B3899C3|nr:MULTISPECIES: endonuclease/exonuclease/phosphatase family protein [unclassified Micromonospora]MBQ1046756.1 endonuclease/exonuclease/phosphatase family protein [Micromonospora sp. C72]MBQ1056036.1 endonuclease/exonuclease/phosphatase family protein [Micromonospora sp. C32]